MSKRDFSAATVKFVKTVKGQGIAALGRYAAARLDVVAQNDAQARTDANLKTLRGRIAAQFTHDRAVTAKPDPGPTLSKRGLQRFIVRQGFSAASRQINGNQHEQEKKRAASHDRQVYQPGRLEQIAKRFMPAWTGRTFWRGNRAGDYRLSCLRKRSRAAS